MSYYQGGYGQQPYGQPPPPQQQQHHQQGYGQYPPPPNQYPPAQQGGYYQQQQQHPPPPPGQYPPGLRPTASTSALWRSPAARAAVRPSFPGSPPPPPGHYGAPAPPPAQYGAPPPQQYGAPVPPTPPSLGYGPPQIIQWDANPDAQALRGAMKGFGTDEKALIRVLSSKDPLQIDMIRQTFDRTFKRSLIKDLKDETSSWFEKGLVQLAYGPLLADVHNLYNAMSGPGTKEVVLNDILLSRTNADMKAIKGAYYQTFRRSLEDTVKADLSMKTERHFLMILAANRAEDAAPVIPQQVDDDVMQLYKATEAKMGTDELLVCHMLTSRNDNQIRAIAHSYKQKFNRDLEKVIKSEFSGHMQDALLFQLRHAVDKYMHAAELLEESMAGMGTKDHLLVARVVRFHWDHTMISNVKAAYQQRYRRSLASRIKGDVSGDYERLMLGCIGEWR